MAERQDFDAAEFADDLATMTDEELFALMQTLEEESEDVAVDVRETSDVFARMVCAVSHPTLSALHHHFLEGL
ncbi:hypothetical protein ASE04_29125 [Rhizobium sp. Root708]|uniref:hypothetical protein n=1 Tax=Rhizobium sp. Root708 TaxID=1736592 RepID=UPI0006F7E22E|nr:hypothetical protein [Rhizobium sp. Root708]KRB54958.1 hypothetical protein ASE04_29125 [Rhizobium sp. Root708]